MAQYCKTCRYDLEQLRVNRCPECGTAFDPLLSETYRSGPSYWQAIWPPNKSFVAIVVGLILVGSALTVPPMLTHAHEGRDDHAMLISKLQTVRSQLELYEYQSGRGYPTLTELNSSWSALTQQTITADGDVYGPYLQRPPVNPFNGSIRVAPMGRGGPADGWEYDERTGRVWIVVPSGTVFEQAHFAPEDAVLRTGR